MKIIFTLIISFTYSLYSTGQTNIEDFENYEIGIDSFLNGSDGAGGFTLETIILPNDYNANYGSWTGWAISSSTDTVTAGFNNQYSSITGGGVDSSDTYAVAYHFAENEIISNTENIADAYYGAEGMYITNATYPYLSMRDGDSFAKKFGGADGNDPDFLSVTFYGFDFSNEVIDSIVFYLADYRFEDNNQDYIINEWTYLDLSIFQDASKITFSFQSSDIGNYGINTPTYFCMDNYTTKLIGTSTKDISNSFSIYPNPTQRQLTIDIDEDAEILVSNIQGQTMKQFSAVSLTTIDVSLFPKGMYTVSIKTSEGIGVQKFLKH